MVSSLMSVDVPSGDEEPPTKLSIAVYVNNISSNMIAMASIPLKKLNISVSKSIKLVIHSLRAGSCICVCSKAKNS